MIWVIRLMPAAVALVCIVLGLLPQPRGKVSHPAYTVGTVVGSRMQRLPRRGSELVLFAPVVRYETPTGEITATARDFLPEWQYSHHPGDRVQVCYDAQQPDVFRLCNDGGTWRRGIFLTIGIGTLLAGGVLWIQYL